MVVNYSVNANMSADLADRLANVINLLNKAQIGNTYRMHVNIYSSRYNVSESKQCVLIIIKLFEVSKPIFCTNALAFNSALFSDSLRDSLIAINSACKQNVFNLEDL